MIDIEQYPPIKEGDIMPTIDQGKPEEVSLFLNFDKGIDSVLGEYQCVLILERGRSPKVCSRPLTDRKEKQKRLESMRKSLSRLPKLLETVESNDHEEIMPCLSELARSFLCHLHTRKFRDQAKYQWSTELRDPEKVQSILYAISRPPETPQPRLSKGGGLLVGSSPWSLPFSPHSSASKTPNMAASSVEILVKKELLRLDTLEGYLYVGFFPERPGLFKVGHTNRETQEQRFKEHKDCYPGIEWLQEKDGLGQSSLKHVRRLEQLILALFARYRRKVKCNHCRGRNHVEWLEVEKTVLLDAIQDWTTFVKHAYDEHGQFNGSVNLPKVFPPESPGEKGDGQGQSLEQKGPMVNSEPVTPSKRPTTRQHTGTSPDSPDSLDISALSLNDTTDRDGEDVQDNNEALSFPGVRRWLDFWSKRP